MHALCSTMGLPSSPISSIIEVINHTIYQLSRDLKIDTALIKDIQASADDREVSTLLLKDGRRVETAPMMVTSGIMALSDGEIIGADVDQLNPEPWE